MRQKLTIVKVGGAVVEDPSSLDMLLDAFSRIEGRKLLVHGGGRTATNIAASLGIETVMVSGRRVTDAPMLDVAVMVYCGLVSKRIVASLHSRGMKAVGICGADMGCIISTKRPVLDVDYGFVGDVKSVNADAFDVLIDNGVIPVVSAITYDGKKQLLNTNADTVASAVACALAGRYDVSLVYCFEKTGVLTDPDDENSYMPTLNRSDFDRLVSAGTVSGGMIPKLVNAFEAVNSGVGGVVITKVENLGTDRCTRVI